MPEKRVDAIDKLIAHNIRLLRLDRKMSQTELAKNLNVSFQQVQKYEKGTNRVGSGRLYKIAAVLGAPVSALFEGADDPAAVDGAQSPAALLVQPYALRMVQAFTAIENDDLRRTILELVEIVASEKH